ncbi:MAG: ATP-dependent DNA helicase RecQ [Methanophagales archaeon]|nr:ATP-dependent DNA helicase RecQ [Methanophagales archaeon]
MNSKDPLTILTTVFKHSSFRPQQEEIIENVLVGRNTLAILPTGAGKSLCFQIPALIFDGLTVVVSPLIALMKDQIDNLKKKGVLDVAYINSMLDQSRKEQIYELLKESRLKMLYVAPETFVDNKLINILKSCNISLIAIDEVHCISIWGHNFRPDYLRLRRVIKALNNPPPSVLGLTATATEKVEEDIQKQLGVDCDVFKDSFDRKNLLFSVLSLRNNDGKKEILNRILEKLEGSVIVYVNFTRTAEELARYLSLSLAAKRSSSSSDVSFYHGKITDNEERKRIQNEFISGRTRIVVATNAFGMGIDKKDIRAIIHYNLPKSIESYYQEVGRAGRDGQLAHCFLLYSKADEIRLRKLVQYTTPSRMQIEAVLDLLRREAGKLIYVNVKRLGNDLKLDEVPIKLALHHLERMRVIRTYFRIFKRAQIKMLNADVYGNVDAEPESESESSNYHQGADAEKIVRNTYFKENLSNWLDLEVLSRSVQISIGRINNILRELKSRGIIELEERDFCTPVKVNPGIKEVDASELLEIFSLLERTGMKKIGAVVEYVESEECKRKFILNYFGADFDYNYNYGEGRKCNACSVCNPLLLVGEDTDTDTDTEATDLEFMADGVTELAKGKQSVSATGDAGAAESTRIAFIIIELMKNLDYHVGRTSLANVLMGSKSKKTKLITQNPGISGYYGVLNQYTAHDVIGIIDQLIDGGYLITKQGDSNFPRPLLYLTELAEEALEERTAIDLRLPAKTEVVQDSGNLSVLGELKKWRRNVASEKNIPAYCVFHDSTLISMANQLPKTRKELNGIKGVGKKKIEDYGEQIIRILNIRN